MQGGFLCFESGLTRSKDSIEVAMKNLINIGISLFIFWLVGLSLVNDPTLMGLVGKLSFDHLFDSRISMMAAVRLLYLGFLATTCSTILSGAIAGRCRLSPYVLTIVGINILIFPIFAHWAWNKGGNIEQHGGWLLRLGFHDFGGSTTIHSVGGWVTLANLLVIGPRLGRFPKGPEDLETEESGRKKLLNADNFSTGHNLPLAALGVVLAWLGWLGLPALKQVRDHVVSEFFGSIYLNIVLSGLGGLLGGYFISRSLNKKKIPQARDLFMGILGGLVSISASCDLVKPVSAFFIGMVASFLVMIVDRLLVMIRIDDGVGAVPVHLAGGIWGTLAVALFGGNEFWRQFLVQLSGILVCALWSFTLGLILVKFINRFFPYRVSAQEELLGLNISEYGAKTELYDLISFMQNQKANRSFNERANVDFFSEVGIIAQNYNQVLDSLEKSERELAEKNQMLEKINKDLMSYDHTVAHDLRNPIAAIKNFSDLIKRNLTGEENPKITKYVSHIDSAVGRAFKIIEGLLSFAKRKIDLASLANSSCKFDLWELFQEVEEQLKDRLEALGGEIRYHLNGARVNGVIGNIGAMEEYAFQGNRILMAQVMTNLIDNALKYSCPERSPIIKINVGRLENGIEIILEDNGIGISREKLPFIFDKFYRVHSNDSKGFGIGLSTVREIMDELGGEIKVQTIEGQGTTFFLLFPYLALINE